MTKDPRLQQLKVLTRLIVDVHLANLRIAAMARDESLARLADLARSSDAEGLRGLAAAEVALRYELWADERRADINRTLAQQTATLVTAQTDAAEAFGRSIAVARLCDAPK